MVIEEGTLQASSDIELSFTDGTNTFKLATDGTGDTAGTTAALTGAPSAGDGYAAIISELMATDGAGNLPDLKGFSFTFTNSAGEVVY